MKRVIPMLFILLLVLSGCGSGRRVGEQAPHFTLPSLYTGEMISSADLRGHPILLMFFSPG
ncbi:MAG: hypothetical protein C4570_03070 [Ammonifex sp.]|jgi:uncharacterized protein YceK|nr:MAG: hypothetical protein C4570_03070 [Ammonifex sp.]